MENTFFEHFYRSCEILKNNYMKFIPIIFFNLVIYCVDLYYSVTTDDITKIFSSIVLGLVGVFTTVYLLNKFYSFINQQDFSLRKVFWDIPTFLFYELGFGLLLLIGLVFLVVPGLYVGFFFGLVPIVSVCFDHVDENIGVFALTKKTISQNKILSLGIYILMVATAFLYIGIENLFAQMGQNYLISFPIGIIYTHILIIQFGIIVSFLDTSIKKVYSIENGEN